MTRKTTQLWGRRRSTSVGIAAGATLIATLSSMTMSSATTLQRQSKLSSGSTVNVTLWEQDTGTSAQALKAGVDSFNSSQSKIHVNMQYIPAVGTSETAFTAKVATALSSGTGPDLVWSDSEPDYVPELVATGDVINLGSWMKNDGLPASSFYPAMLDTGTFNGTVYALPCDGGDYAIMYNKKLFAQAGITSTPTTWAQLAADAKKLTKNGVYGFYVPWGTAEWTVWTWEAMLWSEGGQFLNASNTHAEFDSPQGISALNVWVNMLKQHIAYPSDLANSVESSGYPGFQDGKVAMYIDGSYDLPTNDSALGKSDVGVFAFPKTRQYAMNTGTNMAVMFKASSTVENATWTFIKYMLSPNVQAKYDVTAGFLPTIKATGNTATYKKFLATDPRLNVFLNELNYAHTRPSIKSYEAISVDLGQQLEAAFLGKVSASQALKTAEGQANSILSSASS